MTTTNIDVYGYADQRDPARRARAGGAPEPLIQLIGATPYGDVVSITFHPKHAAKIAAAIYTAATAVERGEDFEEKGIDL